MQHVCMQNDETVRGKRGKKVKSSEGTDQANCVHRKKRRERERR